MKTTFTSFAIFMLLTSQNILANNTIPSTFLNSNELLNINVTIKNESAEINWDSKAFTNYGYFIIERSDNALTFISLDTIFFCLNNQNYLYTDNLPLTGISYYRIRCKTYNEPEYTSNIFDVNFTSEHSVESFEVMKIFPLPFNEKLTANVKCKTDMLITVQIIDINGKVLSAYSEYCNKGINIVKIPVNANIINGIYYLIILDENLNKKIIQIFKQKNN